MASTSSGSIHSSFFDSSNLGRYIAAGSFGFVFEAKGTNVNSISSAIKISFLDVNGDPEDKSRMEREFALLEGKAHPNVLQIFNFQEKVFTQKHIEQIVQEIKDSDEVEDRIAILERRARKLGSISGLCFHMELCGNTLRQWLNLNSNDSSDPAILNQQTQIVQHIVSGLTFLHQFKIIHRDLKPENIMFASEFNLPVKIGDFGLCRKIHGEKSKTKALTSRQGTLEYMAPEMASNQYGLAADLYSLGLIIWEVLQFIGERQRKLLFYELVDVGDTSVVNDHPIVLNGKELIIQLTKRKVTERLGTIDKVEIQCAQMFEVARKFKVKNATEFKESLIDCVDGDEIELDKGIYEGEFVLEKNNVTIYGSVDTTVTTSVKFGFTIYIKGSKCTVRDFNIVGVKSNGILVQGAGSNEIMNISFAKCRLGVSVHSPKNNFRNLRIKECVYGIIVRSDFNVLTDIRVSSSKGGIGLNSNSSKVKRVEFHKVAVCMELNGDFNVISEMKCTGAVKDEFVGVAIRGASANNEVYDVTCQNIQCYEPSWGLLIEKVCKNAGISHCKFDTVQIDGTNHTLLSVSGMVLFEIRGSGQTLKNCRSLNFDQSKATDVTFMHGQDVWVEDFVSRPELTTLTK